MQVRLNDIDVVLEQIPKLTIDSIVGREVGSMMWLELWQAIFRERDALIWLASLVVWLTIFVGLCALLTEMDTGRVEYGVRVLGLGLVYPVFMDSSPVWYWVFESIAVVAIVLYSVRRINERLGCRRIPTTEKATSTVA